MPVLPSEERSLQLQRATAMAIKAAGFWRVLIIIELDYILLDIIPCRCASPRRDALLDSAMP